MTPFAFLSPHQPTPEQIALAAARDITLEPIGDHDPFTVSPSFIYSAGAFEGVVVDHPAAALRLASALLIGVFESEEAPALAQAPAAAPRVKALHLFNLVE